MRFRTTPISIAVTALTWLSTWMPAFGVREARAENPQATPAVAHEAAHASTPRGGSTSHHAEEHGHEHAHPNHVALFMGATTATKEGTTVVTAGLDYERRLPFLKQIFGVGVVADFAAGDEPELLLAPWIGVHPIAGLKIIAAPGVLLGEGFKHAAFVIRGGLGYDFHIGTLSIGPVVQADISEGKVALVYGASMGVGF